MGEGRPRYKFVLDSRSGTWVHAQEYKSSSGSVVGRGSTTSTGSRGSAERKGTIYLLSHASGRLMKVGKTNSDPNARLSSYVRTHRLDGEWRLVQSWNSTDPTRVEREVHRSLMKFRFSKRSREVFACSQDEALSAIRRALTC